MMERGSVRFGDTTIEYQVRRSDRRKKTVQVTVDGGGVQVASPMDTPPEDLQSLVRRRAPWILNHATDGLLAVAPKRFVSGETLPYLGRNVRMVFETADVRKPEVRFDHWRFSIKEPRTLDEDQRYRRIRKAIVAWYRDRAAIRLSNRREKMAATIRRRRTAGGLDPRPAPALGKLRPRRHPAFQLARRHA